MAACRGCLMKFTGVQRLSEIYSWIYNNFTFPREAVVFVQCGLGACCHSWKHCSGSTPVVCSVRVGAYVYLCRIVVFPATHHQCRRESVTSNRVPPPPLPQHRLRGDGHGSAAVHLLRVHGAQSRRRQYIRALLGGQESAHAGGRSVTAAGR